MTADPPAAEVKCPDCGVSRMAIECCGQLRESNYCPDCGKRLDTTPEPLAELLAYCHRRFLEFRDKEAEMLEEARKDHEAEGCERQAETHERRAKLAGDNAARWESWGGALQVAIKVWRMSCGESPAVVHRETDE